MEELIAACGNNCCVCPRYMPKTNRELHQAADLWFRVGYRDTVVSSEDMRCFGCTPDNWCRFKINGCVEKKGVANCGECTAYPCANIKDAFEQTMRFEPACKLRCSDEEYETIKRAFFEKETNLNGVASRMKRTK